MKSAEVKPENKKEKCKKSQREYEARHIQRAHQGFASSRSAGFKGMQTRKNREMLCERADSRCWMKFIDKYEECPQKMPDDRVHQRGHKVHPEDYVQKNQKRK
ncbi:hypothetical protein IW261DRAFT_1420326 [Armillaria novae-zelandiae]|uniref:Uncharacterized protein n=1 Tax=Armillaria novae-zelandiae TaxID=153914 RepID=A0AA39P7G4_9AGAR|nr:hypothetical protein IW261DRAFT_1420326 [Armillaria novae-zelandiae]